MWKHLHKNSIILHFQHGFQSGLSCESQLTETVHDWMTAMDNKTQIYANLLDFAKGHRQVHQISYNFFADDGIMYCTFSSKADQQILQTDLNQLQTWSNKWQMEFNVSKYVHLPITNKMKPSSHKYSLFGHPLFTVSSHPYLVVILYGKSCH